MRTTVARARRLVTAVVGAVLVAGCGSGKPSAQTEASPASASTAPFGQQRVRADLEAAAAAARLPEGLTELGGGESPTQGSTQKERKRATLTARLSPCMVHWSHGPADASPGKSDPAQMRRQLDLVLADLVASGWAKGDTDDEVPLGNDGTSFMATYKKRGWTLHARHYALSAWRHSTAMATKDACFAQVTDEEAALLDD
ncbi:hypothetical protein OHT76_43025 [Streptomyces sp. NBC_00287]|uniref:hypothetical protein n=1 Tax=Streptomyces sp. NBC_00287 TaxID=2975702 RepID=UPI002E2D0541|nr:hypothetical protein [Streptomyces sp. NBC_00287]